MTSIAILRARYQYGSFVHFADSEIPRDLLDRIEAMWTHVASDAPLDSRFRGTHVT